MKETIEWHYTVEEVLPFNGADVLVVINGGPGETRGVVAAEFYKSAGFVLPRGGRLQPSMWCYFPKGQQ